jgi:hypothetical protein
MIGGVVNGLLTILPRIRAHGEGGHVVNTGQHGGGHSDSQLLDLHHRQVGARRSVRMPGG